MCVLDIVAVGRLLPLSSLHESDSDEAILHVNACVLVPVYFWVRNCLEPSELGHADVVAVEDANGSLISLSVTIPRVLTENQVSKVTLTSLQLLLLAFVKR